MITATLWNRTDPTQPTEDEIREMATLVIRHFDGDVGRARLWAID
jgi:hypothetical protein